MIEPPPAPPAPAGASTAVQGALPQWPLVQMMLMAACGFTGFALTLSALPLWAVSRGLSAVAGGALTTTTLAATVACQPLVPALLRRVRTPVAVALGLLALGLPALALLAEPTGLVLHAVCAVRGVGFAVFTVAGALATGEVAPPSQHGRVTGLYGLAAAVPNLAGVPLGVLLLQQAGIGPVAVLAAAGPVLGACLGWAGRTQRQVGTAPAEPGPRSLRSGIRGGLPPSLVLAAVTILGGAFVTIVPIDEGSGSLATTALLVYGVTSGLTRWLAGRWADRAGVGPPLLLACLAAVLGAAALAVGLTLDLALATLAGSALVGAGFGAVQSLTLVAAFARARPADRATVSAVWNIAYDAGTGLGAVLVAALTDLLSPWAAWGLLGLLVVVALPAVRASAGRTSGSVPSA